MPRNSVKKPSVADGQTEGKTNKLASRQILNNRIWQIARPSGPGPGGGQVKIRHTRARTHTRSHRRQLSNSFHSFMLNLQGKQTASLVPPDSESPDPVAVQGRRRCHNGGVPQRTVAQQVADRRLGYLATRSGFGSRCPWLPQSTDASGPF